MTAPASAYRQTLNVRNAANTADILHLPAILHTDKSTMLARFYLDGMVGVVTTQGDAVLGYCRIGSGNYFMHNAARHGSLRFYDAGDCVVFNDGGLNTLGIVPAPMVGNRNQPGLLPEILQYAGQVAVSGAYVSAYYVETNEYGFYLQINGGPFTRYVLGTGIIAGSSVMVDSSTPVISLKHGDTFRVDVFLQNGEGEYRVQVSNYQVNAGAIINGWVATHASWACNRTNDAAPGRLFVKQLPVGPGTQFYYNPTCELGDEWKYDRGISYNGSWYKTDGDGFVVSMGICGGSYPADDPAMINYDIITFTWYELDQYTGCLSTTGGNSNPFDTYRNRNNGKYYASPAGSLEGGDNATLQTGFYFLGTGPDTIWYFILNGVFQYQGQCS